MSSCGPWIATFTGKKFYPLDPRPEDIDIIDIAHALSHQCRYAGHMRKFYCTSEHSIHIARYLLKNGCSKKLALTALLHDGAETYIVDMPAPIKSCLPDYQQLEGQVEFAVAEKFELHWPLKTFEIADADARILHDEMLLGFKHFNPSWIGNVEPLGIQIEWMSPGFAKRAFLELYEECIS